MRFFLSFLALLLISPTVSIATCKENPLWKPDSTASAQTSEIDRAFLEVAEMSGEAGSAYRREFLRRSASVGSKFGVADIGAFARAMRAGDAATMHAAIPDQLSHPYAAKLAAQFYWNFGCPSTARTVYLENLDLISPHLGLAFLLGMGDHSQIESIAATNLVSDYEATRYGTLAAVIRDKAEALDSLNKYYAFLETVGSDGTTGPAIDLLAVNSAIQYLTNPEIPINTAAFVASAELNTEDSIYFAVIPVWLSVAGACEETLFLAENFLSQNWLTIRSEVEAAALHCLMETR